MEIDLNELRHNAALRAAESVDEIDEEFVAAAANLFEAVIPLMRRTMKGRERTVAVGMVAGSLITTAITVAEAIEKGEL